MKFNYNMTNYLLEGLGMPRRYHAGYVYFSGKSFTKKILKSHFLCFSSEGIVVLNTPLTFLGKQGNIIALECWFV